jgi:hypothetical protein
MRLSSFTRGAVLTGFLFVAACNDNTTEPTAELVPVPARDGSPLQSDALDYELRYGAPTQCVGRAVVTYQNPGTAPIYLDRLWASARVPRFLLAPAWPGSYDVPTSQLFVGVGSPALVVLPGAVRVDTLDLDLRDIGQPGPDPRLAGRSGVLRVRLPAYARTDQFGEVDLSAPMADLLSNPFRVRFTR